MKSYLSALLIFISCSLNSQTPSISSFSPSNGPVGTEVVISGANFSPTPTENIVYFGATKSTVLQASATELTVKVPYGATYEPISVLVNGLIAYSNKPFVLNFDSPSLSTNIFKKSIQFPTGNYTKPRAIAMGDFDDDGKADVIMVETYQSYITVYHNTSPSAQDLSFDPIQAGTAEWNATDIVVGDFDADGKLDFAIANSSDNSISVFRNTSSGTEDITFAPKIDFATGTKPYTLALGDIDCDGKVDLATANYESNTLSIFLNSSSGAGNINFQTKVDLPTEEEPFSVEIGDLNNDNKPDLVVANWKSDSMSIYRNISTGGSLDLASHYNILAGRGPLYSSFGDLDGDGLADMVVSNWGNSSLSLYRNTSASADTISFTPKEDVWVGNQPYSIPLSDLDGDNKVDIASSLYAATANAIVFLENKSTVGTLDFNTKLIYDGVLNNIAIALGDLNNDSKPDFAIANLSNSNIQFYRNSLSATDIDTFNIPDQLGSVINKSNHTVYVTMPYDVDITNLVASFSLSVGATAQVEALTQESGVTSNDFTNDVLYAITAEDEIATQVWTISITNSPPNSETDFTAFSIPGESQPASINLANHSIEVTMPYGTDLMTLVPSFSLSEGATASVGGAAQVSGTTAQNFSGDVTYNVLAQDGSTNQDWIVRVSIAPNTETDFIAFSIPGESQPASINLASHSIAVTMPYGTNLTDLTPSFTLSGDATASVGGAAQTSGTTAQNFSGDVTYNVLAQDGTSNQDWTVSVSIAPNTETDFTAFSISGESQPASINLASHSIAVTMPYGADLTALVPGFTLSGDATASVGGAAQASGVTAQNFSDDVIYNVLAQDGTSNQDWTVSVSIAPNTETDFTTFSIPGESHPASINLANHSIAVTMPYGTDLMTLAPSFSLSEGATATVGGAAQASGTSAQNFSGDVTYNVLAQDGSTNQDWIVSVSFAPNTETDFTAFSLPGESQPASINPAGHSIVAKLPFATDASMLAPSFSLSYGAEASIGETLQESGVTVNDFSNEISYLVVAEDGTNNQNWTVRVEFDPNQAPEITASIFTIDENASVGSLVGQITANDPDGQSLSFSIASGNELAAFEIHPSSGALSVRDSAPLDFETTPVFELLIEANDGDLGSQAVSTIKLNDVDENPNAVYNPESALAPKVFPNPVKDKLTIEWPKFKNAVVTDLSGKTVLVSSSSTLFLSQLENGVYILRLTAMDNRQFQMTIIKE